ncbi:MAG TPA: ribosome-associated translation inhibitor RaiA [Alphaproteobacteria bacterium]|jgi:ribosomal subunit interface protein
MHITVTGRHLDVGASLRRRVEEGLAAAVAKYFDRAIEAHVTFDKRGQFFLADIAVHAGRGIVAHSGGEADDPYVAFSGALEHLAKRLRRHKRRLRDHHNAVSRAGKSEAAWQYVLAGPGDEGEEKPVGTPMNGEPLVVAEMEAEIPTLSVGEAVMRLDLGNAPALMFRNAGNGGLNMIYRRADGNIGWVDPGARKGRQG